MSKLTRYRVLDRNDAFCGVWYAASEIAALRLAIAAGYDAWSAQSPQALGW